MGIPSWVGSQGECAFRVVGGWMVGLCTAVRGRFCSCDVRETGELRGREAKFWSLFKHHITQGA